MLFLKDINLINRLEQLVVKIIMFCCNIDHHLKLNQLFSQSIKFLPFQIIYSLIRKVPEKPTLWLRARALMVVEEA